MYKRLFIAIFVIFAYLSFEMAFSFTQMQDSDKIASWHSQPEFQIHEIFLPTDLCGEKPQTVVNELINLSNIYKVNVFMTNRLPPSISYQQVGKFTMLAYLQDDLYLKRLPTQYLLVDTSAEFNQAIGQEISNKEVKGKLGHLYTVSADAGYHLASLGNFDTDFIFGRIIITSTNNVMLTRFVTDLQGIFPAMNVGGMEPIHKTGFSVNVNRYFQQMRQPGIISAVFLFLTAVIYIFYNQRKILIEKMHGHSNIRILFENLWDILMPALVISVTLFPLFYMLHNGILNPRAFMVLIVYLLGLLLVCVALAFCSSAVLIYIVCLKPVQLLKRIYSGSRLLCATYIVKAVVVPLIIISLASNVNLLKEMIQRKGVLAEYQVQYQGYINFIGGTSIGDFIGQGEEGTYIHRVYDALRTEHEVIVFGDQSQFFEEFPFKTTYAYTNHDYVHRYNLLAADGSKISLHPDKDYTLVPEQYYDTFIDGLRANKIFLYNFSSYTGDIFNLTAEQYEQLEEEVLSSFIKLKDSQPIPTFNLSMHGTSTIEDYILIVNQGYKPNNAIEMYVNVSGLDNYQEVFEQVLAEHGLPMLLGYATTDEILDLQIQNNQTALLKALRESLIYLVLLAYISYLTIFFYFKGNQHQVAVKILHGQSLFGRFRAMFSFNLILDCLLFIYLNLRGSYMGINVAFGIQKGINSAFVALLVLDTVILLLSIMSFKSGAMQSILKRNE